MKVELIIIIVSFALLSLMILIRNLGVLYAHEDLEDKMNKNDKIIFYSFMRLRRIFRELIKDINELIKDLPHIVLNFMSKVFYILYKKTKKLVDVIKGNKIKRDGGSISIFLKKIEKDK